MTLIITIFFIVAMALLSFYSDFLPILFTRLATIVLIYSGILFVILYIQSIGSGIGVYSGLFQVLYLIDISINYFNNITMDSIFNFINTNLFVSNLEISDSINNLIDLIFKETIQILKPVEVRGYFDDLISQRMFIEIILFIMCISIILLFIFFIFNVIFLLNKEKIINKFNGNKFITFYINYQAFFSKLSLIYVPIILFVSLITLCLGLHWLIVNQIPYDSLEIDLHKFISSSSS